MQDFYHSQYWQCVELYLRFEVWVTSLGPYSLHPCLGGVNSMGPCLVCCTELVCTGAQIRGPY